MSGVKNKIIQHQKNQESSNLHKKTQSTDANDTWVGVIRKKSFNKIIVEILQKVKANAP